MSQNNLFDELIKNKALNFDADVPADMWERIHLQKKKKKRIGFWWFLIPTVAVIGASVFWMYDLKKGTMTGSSKISGRDSYVPGNMPDAESENSNFESHEQNINNSVPENKHRENSIAAEEGDKLGESLVSGQEKRLQSGSEIEPSPMTFNKDNSISAKRKRDNVYYYKSNPVNNTARFTRQRVHKNNGDKAVFLNQSKDTDLANDKQKRSDNSISKSKIGEQLPYKEVKSAEALSEPVYPEILRANVDSAHQDLNTNTQNSNSGIATFKEALSADTSVNEEEPVIRIEAKEKQSKSMYLEANFSLYNTLTRDNGLLRINREFNNPILKSKFISDEVQTNIHSGFSAGIMIKKQFGRNLKLGTGFNYSQLHEKISIRGKDSTTMAYIVDRLNSSGTGLYKDTLYQVVTGTRKIRAENASYIYSIPVFAEYMILSKNKWTFSLNGGLYFNYMMYQNSLTGEVQSIFPEGTRQLNNVKGIGLDGHLGLRLSYNIWQRVGVYIEPNARMNLVQMKDGVFLNTKSLERIGVMFGTNIRLNKK